MAKILITDDELNLRKVLAALLKQDNHTIVMAENGCVALDIIKHEVIDVLLTDLKMPHMDGLTLLKKLRTVEPSLPVIVITAHGTIETAVSALKAGATDFITKPFDREELRLAIRKSLSIKNQLDHTKKDLKGRFKLIGQSKSMKHIYDVINKVASSPSTIIISGESGTGKELVANALHKYSDRHDKPMICVNCAAIPKDLLESEFFGYEKGAFTGAVTSKPGRFELADKGTLFLDEISEISTDIQVKLLRVLQENTFERVGGIRTIQVNTRLLVATNKDLNEEVKKGNFREDLFYRLNVVPIDIPPLRERMDDIPLLIESFIEKYNKRLKRDIHSLDDDVMEALQKYVWPGNIRELENIIERMILFTEGHSIQLKNVPENIKYYKEDTQKDLNEPKEFSFDTLSYLNENKTSMKHLVKKATADLEKHLIMQALDITKGNITRAAYLLSVSRKGLQNKMKDLDLRKYNYKEE